MRKRVDGKGLAAIIDSLMFICIISVIAIMILQSPQENLEDESVDRSAMLHSVLVHSTLPTAEQFSQDENSEVTVAELLRQGLSSGDQGLIERLTSNLEPLSDALVEKPFQYRWIVAGWGNEIFLGEESIPDYCNIMASRMDIEHQGSSYTSTFYLWIL